MLSPQVWGFDHRSVSYVLIISLSLCPDGLAVCTVCVSYWQSPYNGCGTWITVGLTRNLGRTYSHNSRKRQDKALFLPGMLYIKSKFNNLVSEVTRYSTENSITGGARSDRGSADVSTTPSDYSGPITLIYLDDYKRAAVF